MSTTEARPNEDYSNHKRVEDTTTTVHGAHELEVLSYTPTGPDTSEDGKRNRISGQCRISGLMALAMTTAMVFRDASYFASRKRCEESHD